MTELEKLKIVLDFLADVSYQEESGVTYERLEKALKELETEEMKDRAERAEARLSEKTTECSLFEHMHAEASKELEKTRSALAEAQDRALRFEKLLKAEESRKDAEPVLDKYQVLRTAMDISSQNTRTKSIAILSYHSIRLFLLEICGGTYTENVYRWK